MSVRVWSRGKRQCAITILSAFCFLVLISPVWASFVEEGRIDFPVDPQKISSDDVQVASIFGTANAISKLWPQELDPKRLLESTSGKVLAIKSAYLVKKGIQQISNPNLFDNSNLSKILPQVELLKTEPDGQILIQSPVPTDPFGMLPSHIQCTLEIRHFPAAVQTQLNHELGAPAASTQQSCSQFNMMFVGTSSVIHYFPVDEAHTLVVQYQIYLVKQSVLDKAKLLPFFNLKNRLIGQVKHDLQLFISGMNRRDVR